MSIIGKKTKSRGTWNIRPVTKIKDNDKAYSRNKHKQDTKRRIADND